MIISDKKLKVLSVLKIPEGRSIPFTSCFFPISDSIIIITEIIKNDINIWSRNGTAGNAYLIPAATGIEKIVPQKAAVEVVRFQYIPRTNMAVIPGLTNPVFS